MKPVDFIIIGQGLAGTSLAIRLLDAGKSVLVIDEAKEQTASLVSSGIINPITGRRYVKSWMFDQLLSEALHFYRLMERRWGIEVIKPKRVLRALSNVLEENLWSGQSGKQDYKDFFGKIIKDKVYTQAFNNKVVFGEVRNSYQVDIPGLILNARKELINRGVFIQERVLESDIHIEDIISIKKYKTKHIIFAEGWKVINNPFFKKLPFDPTKGEVIIADLENYNLEDIIKNQKFIMPYSKGGYWIGSTNENGVANNLPNAKKRNELRDFITACVKGNYKIMQEWTAVRPSTKQRRPILGAHPSLKNIFLFNGLGTKGASLAPYFSKMLVKHILKGDQILNAVDIKRHPF